MREFDFEKELQACKEKQKPNETIVFTVVCGRMIPLPADRRKLRKAMEEAIEYIKTLDGFVGVHPVDLWHTILLFDSENNAKGGRNLLRSKGIQCANYIFPILVETKYLEKE